MKYYISLIDCWFPNVQLQIIHACAGQKHWVSIKETTAQQHKNLEHSFKLKDYKRSPVILVNNDTYFKLRDNKEVTHKAHNLRFSGCVILSIFSDNMSRNIPRTLSLCKQ